MWHLSSAYLGKQVVEVRLRYNGEEHVQKKRKTTAAFVYPADRDIPALRAFYMAFVLFCFVNLY